MTDTLIKVDLNQAATENEQIHNRWHPDIPMACWVKPGDDFILETFDWTGGFIKNNDSADDFHEVKYDQLCTNRSSSEEAIAKRSLLIRLIESLGCDRCRGAYTCATD